MSHRNGTINNCDIGKVLNNGDQGWVYCPLDAELDIGGFASKWEACRYAVQTSCEGVEYFEGGDGHHVSAADSWLAYGNTEENAWIAAYKAVGDEICSVCNHPS